MHPLLKNLQFWGIKKSLTRLSISISVSQCFYYCFFYSKCIKYGTVWYNISVSQDTRLFTLKESHDWFFLLFKNLCLHSHTEMHPFYLFNLNYIWPSYFVLFLHQNRIINSISISFIIVNTEYRHFIYAFVADLYLLLNHFWLNVM